MYPSCVYPFLLCRVCIFVKGTLPLHAVPVYRAAQGLGLCLAQLKGRPAQAQLCKQLLPCPLAHPTRHQARPRTLSPCADDMWTVVDSGWRADEHTPSCCQVTGIPTLLVSTSLHPRSNAITLKSIILCSNKPAAFSV
jgi:hypothetical protein